MSLTRQQKEHRVQQMHQDVSSATSVAFAAYSGLTVEEVSELRAKLDENGSRMRVMPKRLLNIVLEQADISFDPRQQDGQIAVIWGDDTVAPAKTLHEFAKDHEHIQLVAGTLEGATLSLEEVTALAELPSRDQLLAQLLSVLTGPTRGFVQALSGVPRNAVYVLQAIADNKPETKS